MALGVVFGFPLLSALALRELTAAHSAVIVRLLPAATAVMAVARAGERPSAGFWVASGAGLAAVLAFAASQGAGVSAADLLVLAAVALGAIGYAEGGALARDMGGNRVICWALVLSLPLTLPIGAVAAVAAVSTRPPTPGSTSTWRSSASSSPSSPGTRRSPGGVAKIGQVQLVQLLTLAWSAALLGEHIAGRHADRRARGRRQRRGHPEERVSDA